MVSNKEELPDSQSEQVTPRTDDSTYFEEKVCFGGDY